MRCKKTKTDTVQDKTVQEKEQTEEQNVSQANSVSTFESAVDMSFFYTNDKIIDSLDDIDILNVIIKKYPVFVQSTKDTLLKKTFLQILDDKTFVECILKHYDMNILQFFKLIYKQYSSLFNTLFIKKVKDKIETLGYGLH